MANESTDTTPRTVATTHTETRVLPDLDAAAADVLNLGRYETATFALG